MNDICSLVQCTTCGYAWYDASDYKHECQGPDAFTTEDRQRLKNIENMLERILEEKPDKL